MYEKKTDQTVSERALDAPIFSTPKQYSFFQINQLLRRYLNRLDQIEKSGRRLTENMPTVRYKANPSLSFPSSDIKEVSLRQEKEKHVAEVVVNFMGLFGPSSPLPAFYTERILQAEADDTSIQDFLNLFNHRLLDLLQRVWEKYRYYQCFDQGQDSYSQWMFSLVGIKHIDLCEYSNLEWNKLMPYAGLVAQKVTNVEKVSRVVEGYFDISNVIIEQCVLREVKVNADQINQMGMANCGMGQDLVLGDTVLDRMGKFRINLFDLSVNDFNHFLPGGSRNQALRQLIRFLMKDQFEVEIRLQAKARSHLQSSMDDNNFMMGWNSCLGDPTDSEVYDAII